MKQVRLDQLSDGIFAIVLTLLAFDLRVPDLPGMVTNAALWQSLRLLGPLFLSFSLSFALLFTYWRAHHYIASVFAKNIDFRMTSINALFFFFIALIPFTTNLLGAYSYTRLAIFIYGMNVIFIGLSLLWMRHYVLNSVEIDHEFLTDRERRSSIIRTLMPVVCAVIAIGLSFYSTKLSFFLFTFAIVFNLLSRSTRFFNWMIESYKDRALS
jgi:uncharacterized membrane protein